MKFGVYLPGQYSRETNPRQSYDDLVEMVKLLEAEGFDSAWLGEHHVADDVYFPPFVTLAGLIGSTRRMTLGTAITILPLHHPLAVAEDAAMLSIISKGRLVLGVGVGYRHEEYDAFGIPYDNRKGRMEEQVPLLKRLWTEDNVVWHGRHFDFESVTAAPKPAPGAVPIWIGLTGMASSSSLERIAEIGDAWILDAATPIQMFKKKRPLYTEALVRYGKVPDETEFPMLRDLYITSGSELADSKARKGIVEKYKTYFRWGYPVMRRIYDREEDVTLDSLREDLIIMGNPAECIEAVDRYAKAGVNHLIFRVLSKSLAHAEAVSMFRRFTQEVAPHFKDSG